MVLVEILYRMLPVMVLSFAAYNYQTILDIAVYGSRMGHLKYHRKAVTTATTSGVVRLPSITLPSLDWEMRFYNDILIKDGIYYNSDVVKGRRYIPCRIYKDILICEYIYPSDIAAGVVKGCLISPFDDTCCIFTLDDNQPIDYRKHCEEFSQVLEEED
mgnify:CR=1 FL=1